MTENQQPGISVVVVCAKRTRHGRIALSRLARQTVARQMELILVVPSRKAISPKEEDLRRFLNCRILEIGAFRSDADAKARGVMAASGKLIAFCEDHCYPAHDWAETLMRRHAGRDWAVVGSTMCNANPSTAASRGCFLVFYGAFAHPRASEETDVLPSNNSAYRAELLQGLGDRLRAAMAAESIFQAELRRQGKHLCQAPECRAWHMQPSRLWPAMTEYFFSSRLYAVHRAGAWKPARRWAYVLLSPGLPLLRSWRALRDGRAAGMSFALTLSSLPAAFAILCAGTAGECLGYALGAGNAERMLMRYGPGREGVYSENDLAAVARL
jgi:GT2 family glycosyltransferase